jgi:hypothetical protein
MIDIAEVKTECVRVGQRFLVRDGAKSFSLKSGTPNSISLKPVTPCLTRG